MRSRRIWEFAFCLVLVAVLMSWDWVPTQQATGPLSVCGIQPGMTRAEVFRILGKPHVQGPSYAYYDNYLRSFDPADRYRKPQITFGETGRVVMVGGPSLEWPGGSLAKGTRLKSALALFPFCSSVSPPSVGGRFRNTGIYAWPQYQLTIYSALMDKTGLSYGDGWFAQEEFVGAELNSRVLAR